MISTLLNPKVWIAVGIAALVIFLYLDIQAKKLVIAGKDTQIATLDGEKTSLTQERDSLLAQIASALSIIETLKADLVRSRKTLKELEFVRNEFNDLRRKFAELSDKPYTCPELETRYEDYSISIASKYNNFLRRKVNSMSAPADSSSPDKAMPNTYPSGTTGNETKAH
jgi:septal ring factor EnvC (AmiA/AmiB activator)